MSNISVTKGLRLWYIVSQRLKENNGDNTTMRWMCALAYLPLWFMSIFFFIYSLFTGSKLYRYHAINALILTGLFFLFMFVSAFIALGGVMTNLSTQTIAELFSLYGRIIDAGYTILSIFFMVKVYRDTRYRPFIAFRDPPAKGVV